LSPDPNQSRAAAVLDRIAVAVTQPRRGLFARREQG